MLSYESIMLSYVNLVLGPLHIMFMCARTVTHSHGVVVAASPIQLKPWTRSFNMEWLGQPIQSNSNHGPNHLNPPLWQVGTTQENLLVLSYYMKTCSWLIILENLNLNCFLLENLILFLSCDLLLVNMLLWCHNNKTKNIKHKTYVHVNQCINFWKTCNVIKTFCPCYRRSCTYKLSYALDQSFH